MEIISRKQAKELGLKYYFTGKPCKHGHITERLTCNGDCVECRRDRVKSHYKDNKEKSAQRTKKWRELNKDKVKTYNTEYYKSNQDKIKKYREDNKERMKEQRKPRDQYHKEYYQKNKDRRKAYYQENKERISEYKKSYSKKNKDKINEWRDANWLKLKKSKREWNKQNPMQVFARSTLQRIENGVDKKLLSMREIDVGYTQEEFIQHIESQFEDGMSWENRSDWHVDHVRPIKLFLADGVTDLKIINALSNLQPLWAKDNLTKGSKY